MDPTKMEQIELPKLEEIQAGFKKLWDKPDGTYTSVQGTPLRYVTLSHGFKLLEQNPNKTGSQLATKARNGAQIAWLIMDNTSKRYWARIENGEVHWT